MAEGLQDLSLSKELPRIGYPGLGKALGHPEGAGGGEHQPLTGMVAGPSAGLGSSGKGAGEGDLYGFEEGRNICYFGPRRCFFLFIVVLDPLASKIRACDIHLIQYPYRTSVRKSLLQDE